ncbi:DNA topoisomerase I [Candidatus Saccharibacteria bacterium]|nr:DNA topoisomerase I [Candidatus Saccharibacteria bacterium]MBQ68544.1 DNA topoisomerase I [Candidatus Saccharibacteria bacterium]
MSKHLVIVESPAKAKTIEKYLGKDFTVLSSIGHIRSIAKKTKTGTPPIDVENGFATTYEVDADKKKTITELKKAVKAADDVWLATDEDREGEAIAWHLCEVLGLDPSKTKRIVFHEITKSAIEAAVKQPRTVDMQLVQAQQARQILDRLVGFELSPVVWQKVPGGKSAGRVQSPAVRLLVEREREIDSFESAATFRVTGEFLHDGALVKAELKNRFETKEEATAFLETLKSATFTVSDITTSPGTRNPGAPFTTSTLQQEANSKLGFGARATMASAQKLYQAGKITYMRTDSVNLSKQAIGAAASYIEKTYGKEYSQIRTYKTKSASAQEAHEAIRPTDMSAEKASSNEYDQKLYDLIRRRTLASQMAPAKLEKTTATITVSTAKHIFEAKGEVIVFDGFLKVYGASKKDPDILPAMTAGDQLERQLISARQVFARPPARYTEGSLVKKLEELGIGRPSTYATIINTIQERDYAVKGEGEGTPRQVAVISLEGDDVRDEIVEEKTGSDKGKLVPTAIGMMISDFLTDHFTQIVDYGFTADVEQDFDKIATGSLARNIMLEKFYTPFHDLIKQSGGIDRSKVAQATPVGTDPKSGKMIYARFGRFGPMLQLGSTESEEKPQFAPMPAGARIETVTLEQALKAFELPRIVGTTEDGKDIKANIGRFGPYIQVDKLFVSIKPLDPHTITEQEARDLYAEKLKTEAEKNIADFGDGTKVLNGRYGPYITDGKKNAKIPKDTDPKAITHEQALELLAAAPAPKRRGTRGRASKK